MNKTVKGLLTITLLAVTLGIILIALPDKIEMAPRDFLENSSNHDETFI